MKMMTSKQNRITNILTSLMGFAGFFMSFYYSSNDWVYLSVGCGISACLVAYKSGVQDIIKKVVNKFLSNER